ncbi:MAG: hypothetical protein LC118_05345, partial [Dehalococcoidia bacterium]|nr:hypothetical protein [Dehalococcoidia bacterium]
PCCSSAAKAAMGGGSKSVNGWRFFSIAGQEQVARPAPEGKPKAAKAKGKRTLQQIKRRRKQDGCSENEVEWFCSACMDSFCLPQGETPDACPKGHPAQVEDELAPPD